MSDNGADRNGSLDAAVRSQTVILLVTDEADSSQGKIKVCSDAEQASRMIETLLEAGHETPIPAVVPADAHPGANSGPARRRQSENRAGRPAGATGLRGCQLCGRLCKLDRGVPESSERGFPGPHTHRSRP